MVYIEKFTDRKECFFVPLKSKCFFFIVLTSCPPRKFGVTEINRVCGGIVKRKDLY